METRQLGSTDLRITPIGLGTAAMGGRGWPYSWGQQDDRDSVAAIHRALDGGVNWLDTAPSYGLGHAEGVVGRALKDRSERPYVFTKCSLVWDEAGEVSSSLRAASVRKECEDSLRRLQTDVIDLYQIHWPRPEEEIEEGWSALAGLQKEGKVRHIGVSNFSVEQMERARKVTPIASLQPPYSLADRAAEKELLPYCLEHGIGVMVWSPMMSGLLTGELTAERIAALPEDDWRRSAPEFREPQLGRTLAQAELLRSIGRRHSRSAGETALAWVLRHPAVTGAIVGAQNPEHVESWLGAGEFRLSPEEIAEIESFESSRA